MQPSLSDNDTGTRNFIATVIEYEKQGDTYVAVAMLEYSHTVTVDENGIGTLSEMSELTVTDLTVEDEE